MTIRSPYKGKPVYMYGFFDPHNSTTTPLAAGATFTGDWIDTTGMGTISVAVKTDQLGMLYIDFSPDGVNADSTLSYSYDPDEIEPPHTLRCLRRYARVRFSNSSSSAQTYLRLQSGFGPQQVITSPLNSVIAQDADTIVTRNISEEVAISLGKFQGFSIVNKFGTNSDVRTGTVPEDIWEGSGVYTGFPSSGQELRAVSTSTNDTLGGSGAEKLSAQAMTTDYEWVGITFTLQGTTPVAPDAPYTTTEFIRCHTANVTQSANGANTGLNAGTITIYQATTTSNIFLSMVAGRNQTNAAAYTVPAGHTAYMRALHCAIRSGNSNSIDGAIWTRAFGRPFRTRRPFTVTNSFRLYDQIYGGLSFTEKSDLTIRVLSCSSASALPINGGFDLILVKDT